MESFFGERTAKKDDLDTEKLPASSGTQPLLRACDTVSIGNGDVDEKIKLKCNHSPPSMQKISYPTRISE